jgi:hypothetical protein
VPASFAFDVGSADFDVDGAADDLGDHIGVVVLAGAFALANIYLQRDRIELPSGGYQPPALPLSYPCTEA